MFGGFTSNPKSHLKTVEMSQSNCTSQSIRFPPFPSSMQQQLFWITQVEAFFRAARITTCQRECFDYVLIHADQSSELMQRMQSFIINCMDPNSVMPWDAFKEFLKNHLMSEVLDVNKFPNLFWGGY